MAIKNKNSFPNNRRGLKLSYMTFQNIVKMEKAFLEIDADLPSIGQ